MCSAPPLLVVRIGKERVGGKKLSLLLMVCELVVGNVNRVREGLVVGFYCPWCGEPVCLHRHVSVCSAPQLLLVVCCHLPRECVCRMPLVPCVCSFFAGTREAGWLSVCCHHHHLCVRVCVRVCSTPPFLSMVCCHHLRVLIACRVVFIVIGGFPVCCLP